MDIVSGSKNQIEPPWNKETNPGHSWQVTLKEKVVAITGANQGIGLGIAEVCLANSAQTIYSLDINEPGADFEELQQKQKNLKFIKADVTRKESVEQAIEEIYEREGRLDGFVANAGMTKHQPALDFSEEQLHQIFELNVAPSNIDDAGLRDIPLRNQRCTKMDREANARLHSLHSVDDILPTE
ncbi:MAG: hypothetical protein Q9181_007101 [Wetmoreana brouardii]